MYTGTQRTEVFRGQPRRVDFGARLRLEVLAAESDAQRVVEAIRRIPGASIYLQVIDATCFTDFTSLDVNDVAWRRLTREKQHPPFSEKDFNYPERTVVLPPEPGRPCWQGGNPVVTAWAAASAWEVIGYLIGGGMMIVGGVTELLLRVPAQQKPLEAVAQPLSGAGKGPRTCRPGMDRGWRWLAVRGQQGQPVLLQLALSFLARTNILSANRLRYS